MKTMLLLIGSLPLFLLTFQSAGWAETEKDNVQTLYSYLEGAEQWVCSYIWDTREIITFHRWSKPEVGSQALTLVVHSQDPELLGSCTVVAFETLRNAAFEMKTAPPKVRTIHYLIDSVGNVTRSSRQVYHCSVPRQIRDHLTELDYDDAYGLGGFEALCEPEQQKSRGL